jgi:phosphoribosylformylglycinamidine cyclo-ligase
VTSYRRAGVDREAAARAVSLISGLAAGARRPEVVEGVGGFAGLFRIAPGRLLAAATDGVGTKVEVARQAGRLDTVGIDLVAMCADDVVCTGAEPLFFLDYLSTGRLDPQEVEQVVAGIAEGCRRAGCALLGGEIAEHPGVMSPGQLDLAGFCVGIVDEDGVLGPHRVQDGDALIGLASTGLHSNGFSLVRRVLLDEGGFSLSDTPGGLSRGLADELLEPTAIYASLVLAAARRGLLHAAAHITGGGIPGNVSRVLPGGLAPDIRPGSWPVPAVFDLIRRIGGVRVEEMDRTFNMGIGMILVVPPPAAQEALDVAGEHGVDAFEIGRVAADASL